MTGCLTNEKIQAYLDGELTNVENAMVRDHLIVCRKCRMEYEYYERLERHLQQPVFIEPPEIIEKFVLRELFPTVPALSSILTFIAASVALIVTWIYIYFNFANNSIIQAIQLTSSKAFDWIGSIIKGISTLFTFVYAIFRVINAFLQAVFKVNIGVEILALFTFFIGLSIFYFFTRLILKKVKGINT